jgi:hypothetical protein
LAGISQLKILSNVDANLFVQGISNSISHQADTLNQVLEYISSALAHASIIF